MLTQALIIRVPGHLLILSASISGTLSLRVGIQEVRCALLRYVPRHRCFDRKSANSTGKRNRFI